MKITVEAFASAREALGFDTREIEFDSVNLDSAVSIKNAIKKIEADAIKPDDDISKSELRRILSICSFAVNSKYADKDVILCDGDVLSILPPVSGGSGRVVITEEPLDIQKCNQDVSDSKAGAVVTFAGTVRNENEGYSVKAITYECKKDMVMSEVEKIIDKAFKKFSPIKVSIAIRTGKLHLEEISIVIAVSASHRKEAYKTNKWILDRIKKKAPIWKYETRIIDEKEEKVWIE